MSLASMVFRYTVLDEPGALPFPRQEFAGGPAMEHFLCLMAGHIGRLLFVFG